jgi:hypothetical protein
MAATKVYLNVPFSQKDAAKALGAKWDAAQKKWYVLDDKELSLFSQWQPLPALGAINKNIVAAPATKVSNSGTKTVAQHNAFVAYNGDLSPWH